MPKSSKVKYHLNPHSSAFTIENYNFAKPFANFFPGIAGKYGIPMWVFYVNRGQAIASFGVDSKDRPILEFFPANKSWQLVSTQGFRTFIKLHTGKKNVFYEPFHNGFTNLEFELKNRLNMTSYDLSLEEENSTLGLGVKVEYFTIPEDYYAALVRIVTITNISKKPKKMQLVDGLPQIIPFGVANFFLKKLSRTVEAWMNVENLEQKVPFYKLDVDPTDRPEVVHIREGNFYLTFHYENSKAKIIKPIVDPATVFGPVTDFSCPRQFLYQDLAKTKDKPGKSKTPSAFSCLNIKLAPRQEKTFYSVIGYMGNKAMLNASIPKITKKGYLFHKKEENKRIIERLQSDIATESNSRQFDLYCRQTYLDNLIRGGYPLVFKGPKGDSVFYLYSRKHGDLERDYNKFHIQPAYFSQGNGNYRDTNQNRRCNIWFNPDIRDSDIITFFNLIQADGFNPLVIKHTTFHLEDPISFQGELKKLSEANISKIMSFLKKPFTPGEMILFLEENKVKLEVSYDEFLNILLSHSLKKQEAIHGEGFWTDHWTYNLDLLESYLGLYPEKLKEIVFDKKVFTYYDNSWVVMPRHQKYLIKDGVVRQFHSVQEDQAKKEMISKRTVNPQVVRTESGQGQIYLTNLINKLLCILANKLAALDPFGMGIEMEADKPNWFDSLNGLPGLSGSSINETFELKRLVILIKELIQKCKIDELLITEEIHNLLFELNKLITESESSNAEDKDYRYWDLSCKLKEEYREKTKLGLSGKELKIKSSDLLPVLDTALRKIESGIQKAFDKNKKIYYGYFINEVVDYTPLNEPFIKPNKFKQIKLPFFLETQMHALRLCANKNEAKELYISTKQSDLYDKKLKMYKVTVNLNAMPREIGRCRVFTRGWLEHESVWLHMEYKFLLELLKKGLYKEFYEEFKSVLIPFQDPQRYGRSILENSSFLVSSAFADKSLHGNGYVARLSGSTAEFVNLWLIMNIGHNPFFLDKNAGLNLRFAPILPGWLFTRKGEYSFNLLGSIRVIYHNPKKKNTFGANAAKIKRIVLKDKDNNTTSFASDTLSSPQSEKIRARQVKSIEVYFG
ncbi:MAG: cellobiose phosphorylase [Candidatus Omnitrophota bacterium]|nr:MAG: cellobiose phosphorylase [Candidatus Omnitrophota bacterium]